MQLNKLPVLVALIVITLLGGYLRFINLENNPNGFYVDEASVGYNSWSLSLTGKDEYGKELPLAFRFLGSYTPPLYTYLTSAVIGWVGLSITSIRLISALVGTLMVLLIFLFVKLLNITKDPFVPLIAALFYAISPWSIFYSRIGYEINLAFFLYFLGVIFLWLSLKNIKWLILGMIFLSLSTNAYHTQRLLAHLTLVSFFAVFYYSNLNRSSFKKFIYKNNQILIASFVAYLLFLIPQILIFFTPANTSRGFGLFYDEAVINQVNNLNYLPSILSFPIALIREFLAQYITYLSPRNLFFQPDSDLQRSLPELSVFSPGMVIFYLIGLLSLVKLICQQNTKFVLMLFLLAPIPAALTGDPFSTQRSLPLLLPVLVIISLGVDQILSWRYRWLSLTCIIILSAFSLLWLYRSYAVLLPNERAVVWGYGFRQLAQEIKMRPGEKFIIDTSRIKPPYIELAFFLKFPPQKLQQTVGQSIKDNYYYNNIWEGYYIMDNIKTRPINWEEDIYQPQIIVGDALAISKQQALEHFLDYVFEIRSPIGEIIFQGLRTNPKSKCGQQFIKSKCSQFPGINL